MPDIPDLELLRINEENALVAPALIDEARRCQKREKQEFGFCRSLFSILLEHGMIDQQVIDAVNRRDRDLYQDATPHDPTVVLNGETPRPDKSPGEFSRVRTARRPPPEVETAARDPINHLGPFVLVRVVGRGGMGKVYRAWDGNVGRIVALKVIDTEDQTSRERFVREAQIAGRLSHPSIAGVYQAGEEGTRGYIAMQFIEGAPADATPLPMLKALEVVRDAAEALSYAHREGVVHRDVKPANLLLDLEGRLFLTDFGLAKEVVANAGEGVSVTGTTFGTPQYMPPEQAAGEHDKIDARSDVYSLGATLYALLAHRPPFTGQNVGRVLVQVIERKPLPVRRYNKEVSPALQLIVQHAMAKDPAKRYPTMAAFAAAIDRLIKEGRYQGRYGTVRMLARRWIPIAIATGLLAGGAHLGVRYWPKPKPPEPVHTPAAIEPDHFGLATAALAELEARASTMDAADLGRRMEEEVLRPVALIAGDPLVRGTKGRAYYVQGKSDDAARLLAAADPPTVDDYRPAFLRALLAIDPVLAAPPPLPALEAPTPEWEGGSASSWPDAAGLRSMLAMKIDLRLASEFERDEPVAKGMLALVEGRWAEAADLLDSASKRSGLPIVARAWRRAAYLSRRFVQVLSSRPAAGSRESQGAALALALESESPSRDLMRLLEESGTDAAATLALATALARQESGTDPRPFAAIATSLIDKVPGAPERRAVLEASRLRWLALSGQDADDLYAKAIDSLGDEPATWSGRLAAIELRLGLAARQARRRVDARPLLEEAVRRADRLGNAAPDWAPPRVLRAIARLRMGQVDDAWTELEAVLARPRVTVRALLAASAVWVQRGEKKRRAKGSWEEESKRGREWAMKVLATLPDHPEALTLAAAASLLLAQAEAAAGREEGETVAVAVSQLTRALGAAPESGEALFHRGRALFLRAEAGRRAGRAPDEDLGLSIRDLDGALKAMPDLLPARYMRGIARFSIAKYDGALEDWTQVLAADPSWDSVELQEWMGEARKGLKR